MNKIRGVQIRDKYPKIPTYRYKQIEQALFDIQNKSWEDVSTLPKDMRAHLQASMPFSSVKLHTLFQSKKRDTYKALLTTEDDHQFETVLMKNRRGQWTICVSSQIGCAMKCTFCATGTMGITRSLSEDEIVDQYRYWDRFLNENNIQNRISNIVFMGMGEPLANYEAVRNSIKVILANTDIGKTKITLSTVGIIPVLNEILLDPHWPDVRIAISLHSANHKKRKEIVPTTTSNFMEDMIVWAQKYHEKKGNRKHHITFEYIMLEGVNDSAEDARNLSEFVHKTGASKVNVIPYNSVDSKKFKKSTKDSIGFFKHVLRENQVDVTERKTMGEDIAAACGQLLTEQNKKKA